jgi:hypothetical protein
MTAAGFQEVPVATGGQIPSTPQVTVGLDPQQQIGLAQWAVQQGGFLVVILVILFFYRRDWKTATEFWKDQTKVSHDLAATCATAVADNAAATRENTVVMHQAKNVIAHYYPERRTDAPR